MSLEELVAALPEAAVGDLVDIFSSTGITPGRRSQHAHAQLATHALPKAGSFSCMVCKKNFGTEATWNAHQKTARHLSAVKEELKRERSEAKKTASNPVVADAQMKARQIDKVASSNPSLAATVLWSVGRTFWEHKRIQDAAAALWKLIGILCGLQDTPRIQTPEAVTLSPSQVTETLYLARIALARIMVQYHEDFAIGLYLDAIEGKFGSWTEEALMIAQMDSFTSALAFSRNVLDNYILPHAVSKKNEDPAAAKRRLSVNLRKVQSIFLEIAGVAAATESIADSTMFRLLALAISEAEARSVDYAKTCLNLADVSQSTDWVMYIYSLGYRRIISRAISYGLHVKL
ncbi:hypothetical protein BC832DRAFT_31357 [Gaertneriomyces semiglobifer]|nr:hypothetical protein BC832DRAFT_31357 [Gaertneriomyces semiglobifer]